MSWADELANDFGYEYAVCFARARDALKAYVGIRGLTLLPVNICPVLKPYALYFQEVDSETGLVPGLPVQLYGYREEVEGCLLEIDPLMTGYRVAPICESSIISFNGKTKMLQCTAGGMFMTNNQGLAEEMERQPQRHWKNSWNRKFTEKWHEFDDWIEERFERIAKWDAQLGDLLMRIPREQVMPWRVMRRVTNGKRDELVKKLRLLGIAVGINYPPLTGTNAWGDTVINFLIDDMPKDWGGIIETIEDVVHGY